MRIFHYISDQLWNEKIKLVFTFNLSESNMRNFFKINGEFPLVKFYDLFKNLLQKLMLNF